MAQDANITAMEYYLDTDPGIGNGVAVPISSGSTQDVGFTVPSASLPVGFHELVVRVMDENGDWSVQQSQVFYVSQSAVTATANITAMEYFFDTDPGYGNGTAIPVSAATNVDVSATIATGALSAGMHELFVRAMDSDGVWGQMSSSAFFVDNLSSSSGTNQLTGIEYFIDSDPGIGSATPIAITPAQSAIDTDVTLNTSSLADGNYTLGMRVMDSNGSYSTTEYAAFAICDGASSDFSATTVCLGTATDFTDLSTGVLAGDTYSWDFDGDAMEDDNTTGSTSFTYASVGTYTATLSIDRSGCVNTREVTVTVESVPSANAGSDQNITVDNATLAATDAGTGETGTWTIITGTGTFSNANDPSATITGLTVAETQLRWTVVNDLAGCSASDDVSIFMASSSMETDITAFSLAEESVAATINATAHTVQAVVVMGTDLTSLTPTITLSAGATISPLSGTVQDFSNSVTYTVTAEDGTTTQDWMVTVSEELNTETDILTFTLPEEFSAADIDNAAHTISILVDLGTDLTSLTPTMTLSAGATISPTGTLDFTNTVTYTVTAEDGITTQDWSVSATERPLGLAIGKSVQLYPNPTRDKLMLIGLEVPYSVSISDLSGKKLDLGENLDEISLKGYAPGLYVLHIVIEGQDPIRVRVVKE